MAMNSLVMGTEFMNATGGQPDPTAVNEIMRADPGG